MFPSIQPSAVNRPVAGLASNPAWFRKKIIEDLEQSGVAISDNQRTLFLNNSKPTYLENLIAAGILTPQCKGFLNSEFAKALESRSTGALSFLHLGADPIIHDASGNNFFHVICSQVNQSEETLISAILGTCKRKDPPPAYFLFEQNALGQAPLDSLNSTKPSFIANLKSHVYSKALQGGAFEGTLYGLLHKKYTPGATDGELINCLSVAAAQNEKNAQLEWAKYQINHGGNQRDIEAFLHNASQAGFAEADYLLAMHVYNNERVLRMRLLDNAALKNHRHAQYEMARELIFNNGNQIEAGLRLAKMAARQGVGESEHLACETAVRIGLEHLTQSKDADAQTEFEYAATRQDAAAQFHLGQLLLKPANQIISKLDGCKNLIRVLNNPACTSSSQLLELQYQAVLILSQHLDLITSVIGPTDIEDKLISTLERIKKSQYAGAELRRNAGRSLEQIADKLELRSTATSAFRADD
jgi:hypothetical protein